MVFRRYMVRIMYDCNENFMFESENQILRFSDTRNEKVFSIKCYWKDYVSFYMKTVNFFMNEFLAWKY